MISKDGVLFIRQAQRMETDPRGAVREFRQHPGYPALILAARQALALPLSPLDEPLRWAVAGQIIALLSRVLALLRSKMIQSL